MNKAQEVLALLEEERKWDIDGKNYTQEELDAMKVIKVRGGLDLNDLGLTKFPSWVAKCEVSGSFFCDGNKLTSLEGSPKMVGGNFFCDGNNLTSLKYAPQTVGGDFICTNNKKRFTEEEVKKVCRVSGKIYV